MRIFWQSFIDATASAPYIERLKLYLNEIAAPGTEVEVFGISPPDRDFGRLSEFRCAVLAVDNGLAAAESGYDVIVLGHFQDPGLYELRSAVRIPVIGTGEATLHFAAQVGRRLGLVSLDDVFEVWHLEQTERYGLGDRLVGVTALNAAPEDFSAAFAGDDAAKARMLQAFSKSALPLVEKGADVIVPAGVLPGLLVGGEHGFAVGSAPVVNCAAVALKTAEMWHALARLSGLEASRGTSFTLASDRARADFRALVRHGRPSQEPS